MNEYLTILKLSGKLEFKDKNGDNQWTDIGTCKTFNVAEEHEVTLRLYKANDVRPSGELHRILSEADPAGCPAPRDKKTRCLYLNADDSANLKRVKVYARLKPDPMGVGVKAADKRRKIAMGKPKKLVYEVGKVVLDIRLP